MSSRRKVEFDDTQTSGIWWSTHLAIKDACLELKEETNCKNQEIVSLIRSIADSIEKEGI